MLTVDIVEASAGAVVVEALEEEVVDTAAQEVADMHLEAEALLLRLRILIRWVEDESDGY